MVFTQARVAVFRHGCFWHGCSEGHRGAPRSSTGYWDAKIETNRRRDSDEACAPAAGR
jgi:DNA mismatch endonuclease (patch repair protein)